MTTVTIPKAEYEVMKKRASLYERFLRFLPERKWGIEEYSEKRIRAFMKEDGLDPKLRARARKMLRA